MIKLMYLAKRKPGFTADQFTRRWRMHGATGMSTSFWRHVLAYVQAEPIRPPLVAGASDEYDGVVCLMTTDESRRAEGRTPEDDVGSRLMQADELETFSGQIPEVTLFVREEVVKAGDLGGFAAFCFFSDADKARGLAVRYGAEARFHRVILNLRREDDGGKMRSTLPFQAVVEASTHSCAHLKDVMSAPGNEAFRQADVVVLTREAVLWDRLSPTP